ncbi:GAF and ANTAR domain-containing protein [Sphaerisporangium siamense]|uniref:GAF domain-containing protein n=1 Tax=Sphaerisporangium siamense TaxID=795645 RepID=A0A7W7D3J5_9ACTN|nr:GAF and ANTAR domain-containing protein [Sphaerisporangium siamense]MBB4699466.1 GAF domain-containing protein [Sphaerisporangium siamense]
MSVLADQVAMAAGVCGATVEARRERRDRLLVASHPDLGELAELEPRRGPAGQVVTSERPVLVVDTRLDDRWPDFCRAALRRGVRACLAAGGRTDGVVAVVTVYEVRPGRLGPGSVPLVSAFAAQAALLVRSLDDGERGRRRAEQLRETMASRWPIEQAKGMIMQALRCDAETAFAELRRASQNSHLKLRDVAQHLIARRIGAPATSEDGPAKG